MAQATVGKWGNNLAVRLPGDIVDAARFREGERVDIAVEDDVVVIRRLAAPIMLADLFHGKTSEAWRAAYAGAYDWGADVGREVVAERP